MTKIPSVEERVEDIKFQFCFKGLVQRTDGAHFTETELVEEITHTLTAQRTALLTELTERIKDMERVFDGCELADHDKSYLAALSDVQAHIDKLINPR